MAIWNPKTATQHFEFDSPPPGTSQKGMGTYYDYVRNRAGDADRMGMQFDMAEADREEKGRQFDLGLEWDKEKYAQENDRLRDAASDQYFAATYGKDASGPVQDFDLEDIMKKMGMFGGGDDTGGYADTVYNWDANDQAEEDRIMREGAEAEQWLDNYYSSLYQDTSGQGDQGIYEPGDYSYELPDIDVGGWTGGGDTGGWDFDASGVTGTDTGGSDDYDFGSWDPGAMY